MKIQILADLHLEFAKFEIHEVKDADVIVIAGDCTVADSLLSLEVFALSTKKPIVFVAGNHEYYDGVFEEVNEQIERICSRYDNFHFLNNESVQIEDVRFIGSTLWSNFDLAPDRQKFASFIKPLVNDFDLISKSCGTRFSPEDCMELNEQSRSFLKEEINSSFKGKKVVVTHFCPSPRSIHPIFKGDKANPYFCCDCGGLMGENVPLWIHGHTHLSLDYVHRATRVIANPRGYLDENIRFNGGLFIEI